MKTQKIAQTRGMVIYKAKGLKIINLNKKKASLSKYERGPFFSKTVEKGLLRFFSLRR
jgi:hypothetical protein